MRQLHANSPGKSIGADLLVGRRNIVIPHALLTRRRRLTAASMSRLF
ncbi:hypothetical protein D554_3508 [Bordetella holmesii 30539]|uniref:Uncharacterized protein n=2 Tax=Bordetella holmesii TaxID=35814 RepID=A0A158M2T6_9BORD|nr:hypothetical protein D560_3612 [Bordetella holmesii ATCC 51541]AIT28228.1 hypothetical protein D558_3588 [Bordetella holmesii 44057]EWM41014.1 hypothetical protein D555_3659 [Bordetella holmesii 35009]EWM44329.1 hypothetical protein D556_3585 [Bordetella holmesii 41130]EWM44906.1 hypothetical protein D557_2895 [Bordetella holmesii 70147]EXF88231.1 hypothetical protein D554_3508 [Bordetella holmesii 30539]EXX94233.1 hypothetical protein D559_1642 [Bordetella holmesii 1058]KAK70285.1 hypoth